MLSQHPVLLALQPAQESGVCQNASTFRVVDADALWQLQREAADGVGERVRGGSGVGILECVAPVCISLRGSRPETVLCGRHDFSPVSEVGRSPRLGAATLKKVTRAVRLRIAHRM